MAEAGQNFIAQVSAPNGLFHAQSIVSQAVGLTRVGSQAFVGHHGSQLLSLEKTEYQQQLHFAFGVEAELLVSDLVLTKWRGSGEVLRDTGNPLSFSLQVHGQNLPRATIRRDIRTTRPRLL